MVWLVAAWEQLAAAAWPYALLACAITWLALVVAGRVTEDASAKAYNVEQRVNLLWQTMLPAAIDPVNGGPETWHDFPAGINGWGLGTGGWKKYRLLAEGSVEISISLRLIGTKTDGIAIFSAGALPAGYQVSVARRMAISTSGNALSANNTAWMGFLADGSVNLNGVNTAGALTQIDAHFVLPLI